MSVRFLTYEELATKYQQLRDEHFVHPYSYVISNNGQWLYMVGTKHTNNPDDPQFKSIKLLWRQFLDSTRRQKQLIVLEGGEWPLIKNERNSIRDYGEHGLATWLGYEYGIEVVSPEPDQKAEVEELAREIGKSRLMYYYFARQVLQWFRASKSRPEYFDAYMQKQVLDRYRDYTGWTDFDFSLENLKKLHKEITQQAFKVPKTEAETAIFNQYSNPMRDKVAQACSLLRNKYIYKEIKKYWGGGASLFVVYGSGHALILESAIKDLAA